MQILAHRGCWKSDEEKNSLTSLFRSLDQGYGVETDIRDLNGELVISHNPPNFSTAIPLEKLLEHYSNGGFSSTLALNIKSDGLQNRLIQALNRYDINNYFAFDMSIPDTISYLDLGITTFIRCSELEDYPGLVSRAQGIWMDELLEPWIKPDLIVKQTKHANLVCIVSSELHCRDNELQWTQIKRAFNLGCPSSQLLLCTDFPERAERFFK